MKKIMGNINKIIRILIAAVFTVLYFTRTLTGTIGLVVLVLGGVLLFTSIISFCLLYTLVGIHI
jgi:hypothetical protein